MDDADRAFEREEVLRQNALAAMDLHPNELPSLTKCEGCGSPIPVKRQRALPGVSTCIRCQEEQELTNKRYRR